MRAHTQGMRVQPVFLRTHPCSSVYMDVCSNMYTYARILRMHAQVCVRMLALINLNFHYFDSFSLISLSNGHSYVLFSSLYWFCPLFQVVVTIVISLLGTRPWLMTQRPWCMKIASSLSSVCFQRVILVPSWCSRQLRGGGTLPTPSTLLSGR